MPYNGAKLSKTDRKANISSEKLETARRLVENEEQQLQPKAWTGLH